MAKRGLDVSHNNGSVDWQAIKNAGFGDFAILRAGYGGNYTNQDDKQFERNIRECERLGIPYGIYLYSYALNTNDAKNEVEHILRLAKKCGKNFKYGIWFDMEDADNYKKKHGMPSNSALVDICYTFCLAVEQAGYFTGIYASKSWLENQLKSSKLDRFAKWLAQWSSKPTYSGSYVIWQYTSSQMINGKRFDANQLIKDFATPNQGGGTTPKKSNEEIADEVIAGKWGNGQDRKNRLTNAGYDYNAIQKIVNQKLGVTKPSYYKKYTGSSVSLVDALKAIGVNSSMNNRKKIAKANGISNYTGTASQNTKLLNLLKQGRLKKA